MNRTKYYPLLITVIVGLLTAARCGSDAAQPPGGPAIQVSDAYARAASPNGAVYLAVVNRGDEPDKLLGAETDVAETVELHQTTMGQDEVMRMSPVPYIEIPAGETVTLQPGGLHIMLLNLQPGLAPGDTIRLTLHFEQAGPLGLEAKVREMASMGSH